MSDFSIPQFVREAGSPGLAGLLALGAEPPDIRPIPDGTPRGIAGYEMLERIGAGAMGTVWRARQLGTRRHVALKLMSAASIGDERAQLRFQREVELTARLDHPHIARVYDSGIHEGIYYYAMELIEGKTLENQIPNHKKQSPGKSQLPRRKSQTKGALRALPFGIFPFGHWNFFGLWSLGFGISASDDTQGKHAGASRGTLTLMSTISRALQHAHERGVIHRDLKPSNIMIDQAGQPHVLDFGLAKATGAEQANLLVSQDGYAPGTLAYMSPEQAGGAAVLDTRSDVYSLGVILFQLLTGRLPRDMGGSRATVLRRIESEEVLLPRSVDPSIDRELQSLLLKSLALDPAARYASAGGLADDIDNYLRGDPLAARPQTLGYLLAKRARRNRAALALASLVASILLGTAVYAYVRIARARNDAVLARNLADAQKRVAQINEQRAAAESVRAEQQRGLAESRLTSSLLAEADGLSEAGRWVEAKDRYREAVQRMTALGQSTFAADSGLAVAYSHAPPPLNIFEGHRGPITATAFSSDGKLAVSGGRDATVRVWDVLSGRCLHVLSGHAKAIRSVAVTPDGMTLLSGGADNLMCQWDLASGRLIRDYALSGEAYQIDISGDSRRAVTSLAGNIAVVWDLSTGNQICTLGGEARRVCGGAIFIPGSDRCAAIADGHAPTVFNATTGRMLFDAPWEKGLMGLAISSDGRFLSGGAGQLAEHSQASGLAIWDLSAVPPARRFIGPLPQPVATAFSRDGKRVAAELADGTIHQWDAATGEQLDVRYGDDGPFDHVAFSRDLSFAVSATGGDASDGSLRLWSLASPPVSRRQDVGTVDVESFAISPDGRMLAASFQSGTLQLWDLETGRILRWVVDPADGEQRFVPPWSAVTFSPDGKTLLFGMPAGFVRLWELTAPKYSRQLGRFRAGAGVHAVAFSHDGNLAVAINGNYFMCWEISSGRLLQSILADRVLEPCVRFSDDDRSFISVSTHGAVVAFDRTTGAFLPTLGYFHEQIELTSAAAYGDNGMILSGSNGDVVAWNGFTGLPRFRMRGHHGRVNGVALSSDRRWAASASGDRTVKLWDMTSGREIRTLVDHGDDAFDVKISADDRLIVSTGKGRWMWSWDLAFPRMVREFFPRLAGARRRLADDPDDATALAIIGEWYSRCGADELAIEALAQAREHGAPVQSLLLARSYWRLRQYDNATREFQIAIDRREAPDGYLQLCLNAVAAEAISGGPIDSPTSVAE